MKKPAKQVEEVFLPPKEEKTTEGHNVVEEEAKEEEAEKDAGVLTETEKIMVDKIN